MEKLRDAFVRNPDGSWFCRSAVHVNGPHGPATFTPGVSYKRGKGVGGYDVAVWLESDSVPLNVQIL